MTAPTVSKKAIAAAVFVAMTATGARRKDICAEMCDKALLTSAGASTYYHNFSSGTWKTAPAADIATASVVEALVGDTAVVAESVVAESVVAESVVAEVTLPDNYTEMTKAELVKLYNSKSEKQVKDFRDHATAVRRVTELFAA